MSQRRIWTDAELDVLRNEYADTPTRYLAEKLGRTEPQIYNRAAYMGLKKSAEYLASPDACRLDGVKGRQTRFQKGQKPWNTGMKGYDAGGRSAETRFSNGRMPHNHVPVGTVVMSTDGYLKIKVEEPKRWKFVHRMNWEHAHGPIPKGMALVFKDGNHENCAVENLELITRQELMSRNTVHNLPKEVARLVQLRGAVVRQINKRMRNEKQD